MQATTTSGSAPPSTRAALLARLVADDALELAHHVGERVRAHHRPEAVVRGLRRSPPTPACASLTASFSVRLPEVTGTDLGPEQLHAEDVQLLALGVDLTHEHRALEPEERGGGRRGDPVLARARLGDHARACPSAGSSSAWPTTLLSLCEPGVGEVLALEQHAHAEPLRQPRALGHRRRAAAVVAQQLVELGAERRVRPGVVERLLELQAGRHRATRGRSGPRTRRSGRRGPAAPSGRRRSLVPPVVGLLGRSVVHDVPGDDLGVGLPRPLTMKSRTSSGSLRPGADSTPVDTSTPAGRRFATAWATLSGRSPPETIEAVVVRHPLRQPPVEDLARPGVFAVDEQVVGAELLEAADGALAGAEGLDHRGDRGRAPTASPRRSRARAVAPPRARPARTASTTRCGASSRKTPTVSTCSGSRFAMSPASCTRDLPRRRGEDEARPHEAPRLTARSASASDVMPQILTKSSSVIAVPTG